MVAGDRFGQDSRHREPNVISLGTWQVSMVRAVRDYTRKSQLTFPANGPSQQSEDSGLVPLEPFARLRL
jgi:hypothetical protein